MPATPCLTRQGIGFALSYAATHTLPMKYVQRLVAGCFALFAATLSIAFPGGLDALVQESRQWIAADTGQPIDAIEVIRPDDRAVVRPCEDALLFRFPFRGNQRTLEVSCNQPSWKFFLRTDIVPTETVVVTIDALASGTLLTEESLALMPIARPATDVIRDLGEAAGQRLNRNVSAGEALRQSDLAELSPWFELTQAVAAGQTIALDQLKRGEDERRDLPRDILTTWPMTGDVFATRDLAAGEMLRISDIDRSVTAWVAAETLVRGTVIAETDLQPRVLASRQVPQSAVQRREAAVGLQTVRTVRAGDIVLGTDLMAADLVRKGESVTLSIRQGALTITVSTVALSDGKLGEQVNLQNPDSGKVIQGIVTGRHRARGL
ncbi:MAG: flagellar basal body P-ring formation chaperone FlgA [Litorivicinaceae bacterium]|nr:flagellar basal body P-ring formation chaperone FlgA [Litorivicinaceae bacterium]